MDLNLELDVLAAGDLNIDLVLTGCPLPEPGQERLVEGARYSIGGSAAIFACNLASLGAKVGLVACIGDDAPARFLLEEVSAIGVNIAGICRETLATGITVILALPGREQKAMLTYRGAIESLAEEHLPDALLRRARHLHIGSYYMLPRLAEGSARLFRRAHENSMTVSLDTNDDPLDEWGGGLPELLRDVDIFFPNRREALQIARETDLERAGRRLAGFCRTVVVKADADGALLFTDGGHTRLHSPPRPATMVDSTGAGDSFDAGFLRRWLERAPLEECLRFGNECGARAISAPGGTEPFRKTVA